MMKTVASNGAGTTEQMIQWQLWEEKQHGTFPAGPGSTYVFMNND